MNYLQVIADEIKAHVSVESIPREDTDALFLIYASLLLAKGCAVTAKDVHDAWGAWMSRTNPTHESLQPYDQLSEATRKEDSPFLAAILNVARQRNL
jgi:hypothetical protein